MESGQAEDGWMNYVFFQGVMVLRAYRRLVVGSEKTAVFEADSSRVGVEASLILNLHLPPHPPHHTTT